MNSSQKKKKTQMINKGFKKYSTNHQENTKQLWDTSYPGRSLFSFPVIKLNHCQMNFIELFAADLWPGKLLHGLFSGFPTKHAQNFWECKPLPSA